MKKVFRRIGICLVLVFFLFVNSSLGAEENNIGEKLMINIDETLNKKIKLPAEEYDAFYNKMVIEYYQSWENKLNNNISAEKYQEFIKRIKSIVKIENTNSDVVEVYNYSIYKTPATYGKGTLYFITNLELSLQGVSEGQSTLIILFGENRKREVAKINISVTEIHKNELTEKLVK